MKATGSAAGSLNGLLNQFRLSFAEFWALRDARERAMLAAAALLVTFSLAYLLLLDPAIGGRNQLTANLPALRLQVAQMQAMAKEAAALAEQPATTRMAMSKENIEAALARNGLKPQSVVLTDDFAKIQLASASFASTLNWLNDMQKSALLAVVDANVVTLDQPDMVNATFTLRRSADE